MNTVQVDVGRGMVATIDAADAERVREHEWRAYPYGDGLLYATVRGVRSTIYLHRFILSAPEGIEVDHRDGDGLNNTRANLRAVSHRLNLANQKLSAANTSGYKGVQPRQKRAHHRVFWVARIKDRGRNLHIGCFASPEGAARAYDAKARELWGEHARTNADLGLLAD